MDVEFLANVLGTHDQDTMKEILTEFMRESGLSWTALKAKAAPTPSGADCDPVALADAAHGAKGEARSGGARLLGEMYADLEHAATRGALDDLPQRVAGIESEVGRVKGFIAQYLREAAE